MSGGYVGGGTGGYVGGSGGGGSPGGAAGKSAFQSWKDLYGDSGSTEADFILYLKGTAGIPGFGAYYSSGALGATWQAAPMDLPSGQAIWFQTVAGGAGPPQTGRPNAYPGEPIIFKQA